MILILFYSQLEQVSHIKKALFSKEHKKPLLFYIFYKKAHLKKMTSRLQKIAETDSNAGKLQYSVIIQQKTKIFNRLQLFKTKCLHLVQTIGIFMQFYYFSV